MTFELGVACFVCVLLAFVVPIVALLILDREPKRKVPVDCDNLPVMHVNAPMPVCKKPCEPPCVEPTEIPPEGISRLS